MLTVGARCLRQCDRWCFRTISKPGGYGDLPSRRPIWLLRSMIVFYPCSCYSILPLSAWTSSATCLAILFLRVDKMARNDQDER
jgi:hypothetical protein